MRKYVLAVILLAGLSGNQVVSAQAQTEGSLSRNDIGIIFMPHGADSSWNAAMDHALSPLREHYTTVNAYSMADPRVVQAAADKLETQGMKAAVVVRIFSLASSFRAATEYMLGLSDVPPAYSMHGSHRIQSTLRFATTGGMEAHPLLAQVMAQRAQGLSIDPSKETVILVGHGAGSDADNDRWIRNLEQIGSAIVGADGQDFRKVVVGTWREDWPEERDAAVADVRAKVAAASENGGTAIVIPVRTIGQGPEREYLDGFSFRLGQGFAPHPLFVRWVASEIEAGIAALLYPDNLTD